MKRLVVAVLCLCCLTQVYAASGRRMSVNAGGVHKGSGKALHMSLSPFVRSYRLVAKSAAQIGAPKRAANLPDDAFLLRDVYVYPNPAKEGKKPIIHVEVGIAEQVQLHMYDAAGDLVHHATVTDTPQIIDDGSGRQYAYEYTWDGDIASGVYLCVVRAQKTGYADLGKTIKVAVIR